MYNFCLMIRVIYVYGVFQLVIESEWIFFNRKRTENISCKFRFKWIKLILMNLSSKFPVHGQMGYVTLTAAPKQPNQISRNWYILD